MTTAVANHLIKVTKATRLMGCECAISGVSPAIAQTIVELGIDVGEVKTTANMRDALSAAFRALDAGPESQGLSGCPTTRSAGFRCRCPANAWVASIQVDLTSAVLQQFRQDLLEKLQASQVKGVILDLSGVEVMDLSDFENIRGTVNMARMMGSRTVLCGLKPGVVASLVALGARTDDLYAARDLDMGFELLTDERPADGDSIREPEDG